MNILVIGSGAREHTLVWKLAQSDQVKKIYAAPGNGGITESAECVPIKDNAIEELAAFAQDKSVDLTVVGPEQPLTMGIVDYFLFFSSHPFQRVDVSSTPSNGHPYLSFADNKDYSVLFLVDYAFFNAFTSYTFN